MARRRMIDPSFWEDTAVGSLTFPARILFIALFSNADDEGRIAADHRFLRRTAFGFDDVSLDEVDGWLEEIVGTLRNVTAYEVEGHRYIQLSRWRDYQTINRPSPSKLPPPAKNRSRKPHEPFTDDSLNDHGVLIDDSRAREGKGKEEKGKEEKGRAPAEDGGVIFSEPEMREGNGDGFVPSESDRNAIFAAVTRFHTKHADPNSTEAERQAAFATWMGNWVTKTAAGNFERELALSRTAYDIYPALQAAARKQTEVSNATESTEGAGQEGAGEADVEEGATDGGRKPRGGRRRRVGLASVE